MAYLMKLNHRDVSEALHFYARETDHRPKKVYIDPDKIKDNYRLHPARHGTNADECCAYYEKRLAKIHHVHRSNLKTVLVWIINAPKDLLPKQEKKFFRESYRYLNHMYGAENCIQCIVHKDGGMKMPDGSIRPVPARMHYLFIPTVEDEKYGLKVCASERVQLKDLYAFHPGLERWIHDKGIHATICTGVTKQRGGNQTVSHLKKETYRNAISEGYEPIALQEDKIMDYKEYVFIDEETLTEEELAQIEEEINDAETEE